MNKNKKWLNLILPFATFGVVLGAWAIACDKVGNEFILPSISQTFTEIFALLKSTEFYLSLGGTVLRSLIAFLISFGLAFSLAILSVKFKSLDCIIKPIITVTRALPTIAVVLLLLLWTNSKIAPVIVTMLVVLPTTYTHIESAYLALDQTVSEASRADGADERKVFSMVEFPQMLPTILSAIGSGISLNFKLMVAAEVIAQTANSIGYMLNTSKAYFETATMFALVCVSVLFGVIIETIFNYLSKKIGR